MLELLKEKYDVIRKIGQGGMAKIFLAKDKETGKTVAIKIMDSQSAKDIVKRKRFEHEIRLLKKIDSPNVVKLFDGYIQDEHAYIVMEHVDGYILKDYIRKRARLTVDEAVDFARQLAMGFDEIHNHKVIHRDIKSQNIMVGLNNEIKIIDFGIAIDDDSEELTKTGILIGSPQYVAPELVNQEEPSRQSDIYALGVILYEMLSGDVPHSGKDALEILLKHRDKPFPRITRIYDNVPQSVENVILKATAKDLRFRYKTMYEMFLDLKTVLSNERNNEPLVVFSDKKKKKTFKEIINSKWFPIITIGILLALIIILVVAFLI